jgi:uncharacterized protein YggE
MIEFRTAIRLGVLAACLCSGATATRAQAPPAELGARYVPAPWWMREPVIASIGMVRTEIPANRAGFNARFNAVARTSEAALAAASAKVAEIDAALRKLGPARVRIVTTFGTQPLYEQYRDKEGNLQTNARPDKIERYAVEASLDLEIRDVAVLEAAYGAVVDARPDSVGSVNFSLEPDNATKTWLQTEAVKDAARRAREAAAAAGARLLGVKVIDPTARACQTDVLAGWPSYGGGAQRPTDVQYAAAPPAPVMLERAMMSGNRAEGPPQTAVSLQPPFRELADHACVVYGLQ